MPYNMKVAINTNLSCFHIFCYNSEAIEEYYGIVSNLFLHGIEKLSNTHTQFHTCKYAYIFCHVLAVHKTCC